MLEQRAALNERNALHSTSATRERGERTEDAEQSPKTYTALAVA